MHSMDRVEAIALARGGTFTGTEAVTLGADPMMVRRYCLDGRATRLRRNAYVLTGAWQKADADGRARLTAQAILLGRPGSVGSHHTAVMLHGLPLFNGPIQTHVLAPVTRTWITRMLHVHPGSDQVTPIMVDGFPVVPVEVALAQVASSDLISHAVVPLDAALHRRVVRRTQVRNATGPDVDPAITMKVLSLADDACESVGETRTRILLQDLGFEVNSQVDIRDRGGRLVGRVDFLVEGKVIVEFDGAAKYDGAGGREALVNEKVREDALRALGYHIVRIMWADLNDPAAIRARVLQA